MICLAVVFYFVDLKGVVEALQLAEYRMVTLAFGVAILWLLVRGLVWRTLLQEQASYSQTFFTIAEGYLLNNLLPFRLGEVGRAFLLSQKAKLGFWQVFSTILIERVLDLAMAAGLLLSTLAFVVGAPWAVQAAWVSAVLVISGLAMLYALARSRDWAERQLARLGARWPVLLKIGANRLESFFAGLEIITNGRRFLKAVLWMVIDWGVALLQYYLLLQAFFPDTRLLWAAFSLSIGALGIAAPSSPGAVGVLELSLIGALAVFGLDPSIALAFALVVHLFNYVINGTFGAIGLIQDGQSLSGLYRRIRKVQPAREQS